MEARSNHKDKNWEKLVSSLKKGIAEMEKERKTGKQEQLNAVEVICSYERHWEKLGEAEPKLRKSKAWKGLFIFS